MLLLNISFPHSPSIRPPSWMSSESRDCVTRRGRSYPFYSQGPCLSAHWFGRKTMWPFSPFLILRYFFFGFSISSCSQHSVQYSRKNLGMRILLRLCACVNLLQSSVHKVNCGVVDQVTSDSSAGQFVRNSSYVQFCGAGMAQWLEYPPPTNVARVRFLDSTLLLVLFSAPSGFSPGTPVFPSPQKPTLLNSNSIRNARTFNTWAPGSGD